MKWRKLVDLDNSSTRKHRALELFLDKHKIRYVRNTSTTRGYTRFLVQASDLCCAQAVLQAIEAIGEVPPPPRAA
jgi:hypothetical protein